MCNAYTKLGFKCLKEPKKDLCYTHNKVTKAAKVISNESNIIERYNHIKQVNALLINKAKSHDDAIDQLNNKVNQLIQDNDHSICMIKKLAKYKASASTEIDQLTQTNAIIKNSYNQVTVECNQLKKTINTNRSYQQTLENRIKNLNDEINRLTERLNDSNKLNDRMKPDFDRYQIIRSYEGLQQQLEHIKFNHRGNLYHDLRLTRNQVAHPTN
jgi:chromosome segregation ATPase